MVDESNVDLPMTGDSGVDGTHALQVRLLGELEHALAEADRERALELIGTLDDYSEAHFAAEQILMRRHSYPGYHSHVAEHARLVDQLRILKERIASEKETNLPSEVATIRSWLLSHIRTADQAFASFAEKSQVEV